MRRSPAGQRLSCADVRPATAALAALCALALCSCGDTLQVQPIPHNVLEGVVVAPFPVYWLGANFRGLAVSDATHDPSDAYALEYGNCVQGGQGYCVPPLRLVTSPDNGFLPGGSVRLQQRRIRGANALLAQGGKTIVIATGDVVLDIYADSAPLALAAAHGVVPINVVGVPGEMLPARMPDDGFEQRPLPTQVPNPLRVLDVPFGR